MAESRSHKQVKAKAAGRSGRTEVPLSRNRRLDAATKKRATEVERGGRSAGLRKAAIRLKDSGRPQKVLQVPIQHMDMASKAMREAGVSGTVKNLGGTKRRSVR